MAAFSFVLTASLGWGASDDPLVVRVATDAAGRINVTQLLERVAETSGVAINLPKQPLLLPLRGASGGLTRSLLAKLFGEDVQLAAEADALVVTIDRRVLSRERMAAWRGRLSALADRVRRETQIGRAAYGMRALASYRANDPGRPTVCLVHGMNSSSQSFVHMIPLLEEAGYGVVVYDYADNQDLDITAPQFVADWRAARAEAKDRAPWAIIGHSMGALLGRYYVEGDGYAGDVSSLILIAPPNGGSAMAKAQGVFQLLQNGTALQSVQAGALVELAEGLGEAADDVVPGSAFLKRLDARPRRAGVPYHILAGDAGFLTKKARAELDARIGGATRAVGVLGKFAGLATKSLSAPLDELTDGTGDGGVSVSSTQLDGVTDRVVIHANHVELIRGPLLYPEPGPVVCMPYVLKWLAADAAPAR